MDNKLLKRQIQAAMDKEPRLSDYGIGVYHSGGETPAELEVKFQKDRMSMLRNTGEFAAACEWLQQIDKRKTINMRHSSYGLKHIAEEYVGYISNGMFIAAAIHCGFDYITGRTGGPNVAFNMSEKSIKRFER